VRAREMARLGSMVGVAVAVVVGGALPASAAAEVVRPDECGWQPGPGETESIPGTGVTEPIAATFCQVVFLEKQANYLIRGEMPAGHSVERTLVLRGPNSITVVTRSGQITETGTF
jgi:hypothetical protein